MTQTSDGTSSESASVRVRNLWKVFGPVHRLDPDELRGKSKDELQQQGLVLALRDVTFDVGKGETFVVMGLSGSGKSTLIRCLIRLIEPSSGEIYYDGGDILTFSEHELVDFRRTKVGMVFQHYGLLPHRTVLDNVAWGLEVRGVGKKERYQRAQEVIDLVGLSGWESQFPTSLSGGMQQRVGLARALAADPPILLMDEPFSGLDPLIRREMQDELVRLQEQLHKTIIFITHDLNEAVKLGSRITIMRDGEVIQQGTAADIIGSPADRYVEEFIRDIRRSSVLNSAFLMKPSARISAEYTPYEAIETMRRLGAVSLFVVADGGEYVGTIGFADAARASERNAEEIRDFVHYDVPVIREDASLDAVLPYTERGFDVLPVVNPDNLLVGALRSRSVRSYLVQEAKQAAEYEAEAQEARVAAADGTRGDGSGFQSLSDGDIPL